MNETDNGKETWTEAIDQAKQRFAEGWQELGRAADLAKGKGEESLKEARVQGREAWQNATAKGTEIWKGAQETGQEAFDELRGRGEEALEDAEQLVRKHPAKAVGLSILVGVLLGVLLCRDRD